MRPGSLNRNRAPPTDASGWRARSRPLWTKANTAAAGWSQKNYGGRKKGLTVSC